MRPPQAAAASSQVKCNHFGRSSRGAAFALGRIAARDLGVVMTTLSRHVEPARAWHLRVRVRRRLAW